jgi:hypothetical protein
MCLMSHYREHRILPFIKAINIDEKRGTRSGPRDVEKEELRRSACDVTRGNQEGALECYECLIDILQNESIGRTCAG